MPVDFHYICKRGENFRLVRAGVFDTGNWTADVRVCRLAIGGRIFLHEKQRVPAWHGGTIIAFREAPSPESHRKVFTYQADLENFRILCPVPWAQQSAVAWWNDDRTAIMQRADYLKFESSLEGND